MIQFLISHIDAVISTVAGLLLTAYAFRNRQALAISKNKIARLLPTLAPIVVVFGLIQFFIPSTPSFSSTSWTQASDRPIVKTDDGIASVEFPVVPEQEEAIDQADGIAIQRTSHSANLANGMLNLRLSFSQHNPGAESLPPAAHISSIREYFVQGGFTIIEDAPVNDTIWALQLDHPTENARIVMRVSVLPSGVYRALSTSMEGHHEDPRISRFMNSFTVQPTPVAD